MSQIAVAEFMNAASSNSALLNQIAIAGQGRSESEVGDFIAALGREAGYSFSAADALAFRESALARFADSSIDDEDSVLEGVRGGSGDPYLNAQLDAFGNVIGSVPGAPSGTGIFVNLAVGAAQGDLGGAAEQSANSFDQFKETVRSIFSGW